MIQFSKWSLKKKLLLLGLAILIGFSITPVVIITRTYFIIHSDQRPQENPISAKLQNQTESFTCGVHAVSTVYKAYGLDPEAERIRWRLGADTKALFWMADSTGSLHPDMFMVLEQDYFMIEPMKLENVNAWDQLKEHLETGHMSILLISRRENGNLHWVVANGVESEQIIVYDPLFENTYLEGPEFLQHQMLSALNLQPIPGHEPERPSSIRSHLRGSKETAIALERLKNIKAVRMENG